MSPHDANAEILENITSALRTSARAMVYGLASPQSLKCGQLQCNESTVIYHKISCGPAIRSEYEFTFKVSVHCNFAKNLQTLQCGKMETERSGIQIMRGFVYQHFGDVITGNVPGIGSYTTLKGSI